MDHDKDRTKATAAIPMVGTIVTGALLLLSGLSLISSSYQPAIAQQQDMTTVGGGGGGATTDAGTAGGGTTTGGNATTDTATLQGGNATTAAGGAGGGGGNDSVSQIRMHIEAARTALQNNDTQGAMLHLELADNALGGAGVLQGSNMTAANITAGGATNMTTTGGGDSGNQTAAGDGGDPLEGIFGGGGG